MSPERKAVVGLLLLATVGHGVRLALLRPGEAPGAIQIVGAQPGDALLARHETLTALARPLQPGEQVNLDRARAEEIARLPGVGMGLAKRIVEHRKVHGSLGSLGALDGVPGIGPALLGKLGGLVVFEEAGKAGESGKSGAVPPLPPASSAPPASISLPRPPDLLYVLNHGDLEALDRLPGIGPARARSIVSFRDSAGFFTSLGDLERVPGLSRATVHRLTTGSTRVP